jgi:hypothetical protein
LQGGAGSGAAAMEEANRAAVHSGHRVLDLLSNPHGPNKDLAAATGEALARFGSLTANLGDGNARLGHARVRHVRKPLPIIDSNLFLESTVVAAAAAAAKTPNTTGLQLFPRYHQQQGEGSTSKEPVRIPAQFHNRLLLQNPEGPSQAPPIKLVKPVSVALPAGTPPHPALPGPPHLHFIQQQHPSYQRYQFMQQMKIQSEMMKRSNLGDHQGGTSSAAAAKGVNLKFDGSNCTASSSRSFLSSLSLEGSLVSLDGNGNRASRPFQLLSGSQTSSTPESGVQRRRCTGKEDGTGRCATRCHCAKKRFEFFFCLGYRFISQY